MSTTKNKKPNKSQQIAEEVTATILQALEEGTVPWRKPWQVIGGRHYNANSQKTYRGINQFTLDVRAMAEGYKSPAWMTFKQANKASFKAWRQEHGAPDTPESFKEYRDDEGSYRGVRRGEESALIVFWKLQRFKDRDDPDKIKTVPLLKYFRVFNSEQTDLELELPDEVQLRQDADTIEAAETILDGLAERDEPKITEGGNRAYYAPRMDIIGMPEPEQFNTDPDYYRVLFHELTHWTGHESRKARPEITQAIFGREASYAREELVAELGAAMLMAHAGIDSDDHSKQSAAYIDGWRSAISDDPRLVITAGSRAQSAVDYITGATYDNHDDDE